MAFTLLNFSWAVKPKRIIHIGFDNMHSILHKLTIITESKKKCLLLVKFKPGESDPTKMASTVSWEVDFFLGKKPLIFKNNFQLVT